MNAVTITAYAYNAAIHCPDCTRRAFGRKDETIPADVHNIPDAPNTPKDREGNPVHPIFATDDDASGYCDTCGMAYGDAQKVARVLSVEAWRERDGEWTWNSWHARGFVPLAWCDLPPRTLMRHMRERDAWLIPPPGWCEIEDDGYNIVFKIRGTGEPVAAIEYGSVPA